MREKEEEEGQGFKERDADRRGLKEPGKPRRRPEEGILVEKVGGEEGDITPLVTLLDLSFREDGYRATEETLLIALCEMGEAILSGISTVWRASTVVRGRPLPVGMEGRLEGSGLGARKDSSPEPRAPSPEPIGMIEVRRMDVPPFGPHYLLSRLVVLPECRGGGVARALIQAAVSSMTEDLPILAMTLGREIPRSYRRLGAVPIGQVAVGSVAEVKRRLSRGK